MAPGPGPDAPGPLGLVQSFASTCDAGPDQDLLGTREDAAAWRHAASLLPAEAGLSNSEHSALATVAVAIADSAAAGTWGRLKGCSAPDCGRAFYDGSPGQFPDAWKLTAIR